MNTHTLANGPFARVVVKTEAAEGDATDRRYGSGFNGEHACGRLQQLSPMNGVPVSSPAIDRRVLAHRRHDNPIGERQFAHREG